MKIEGIDFDIERVVDSLRELYVENHLSIDKALDIVKEYDPTSAVSRSTIAKVFRKNGDKNFKWEATLKPIANALLNCPEIESGTFDVYNSVLKLKQDTIKGIQTERDKEKIKYHEDLEKKIEQFQKSLDFLKAQVELKDQRITQLLDANLALQTKLLNCHSCTKGE